MAEKRLIDANELEEKAIYITGPKGSACHAVPLGLIQAAPTIDPAPGKSLQQLLEQLDAGECKGIKSATAYKIAEFAREQGYLE